MGEVLAGHAAANADTAEAKRLDRLLDLVGGEVGILQCGGRKGDEPIWLRGTELDEGLVLDPNQFSDGIALGPVPVWIDAECLDIDARLIHLRQTVADIGPQETRRFERVIDQLRRLRDDAMRMHINGLDPLATHDNLAAAMRLRTARTATLLGTDVDADFTVDKGEARASVHGSVDRHFHSSRSADSCNGLRVLYVKHPNLLSSPKQLAGIRKNHQWCIPKTAHRLNHAELNALANATGPELKISRLLVGLETAVGNPFCATIDVDNGLENLLISGSMNGVEQDPQKPL